MEKASSQVEWVVVVGRWSLLHNGHMTLINAALRHAKNVIIVIGSAFRAREFDNPFTADERKVMINAALPEQDRARMHFLPVRDYYDDERWNAAVDKGVRAIAGNESITLMGYEKDHTSYYQRNFRQWDRINIKQELELDATSLRQVFFCAASVDARIDVMKPLVPSAVLDYLNTWALLPAYEQCHRTHLAVLKYREEWPGLHHLAADGIIIVRGHVLMVRRGSSIGYGLWAFPGGIVDPGERFYDAAVREAREETTFDVLASTMKAALRDSFILDHPRRSPRGRMISMAYVFDFGSMRLPEVSAKQDSETLEAQWIKIDDLHKLDGCFFEDHDAAADRVFNIWKD